MSVNNKEPPSFTVQFSSCRNRVAERSSAISRVAKPTLGSPVIFSSNGSPLKEFLDSPLTRQVAKHHRQIEEKNGELREIKAELDRERMEKQFLVEETSRLKQERKRLESDNCDLKMKMKEVSEAKLKIFIVRSIHLMFSVVESRVFLFP